MVTSTTCYKNQTAAPSNLSHVICNASQDNFLCVKVHPAPHGVKHRLWLLEDLFLHEWAEVAWKDILISMLYNHDPSMFVSTAHDDDDNKYKIICSSLVDSDSYHHRILFIVI